MGCPKSIADHTSRKHVKHFFYKNIVYKDIEVQTC